MTTIITGPGIRVYQAMVVRKGLEFWLKHKRPLNRMYTPKNLVRTAATIVGRDAYPGHGASSMVEAISDLTKWIDAQHGGIEHIPLASREHT
jgi:hypothetical protein